MFATNRNAIKAYTQVGVETGIDAASPHKLIVMLFDGALLAITNARQQMAAGQIAEKGTSISRAIDIVSCGLKASLDKSAGGELAENLDALYGYIISRLLQANLKNDLKALEEVGALLNDIRDAWRQIADDPAVRGQAQGNTAAQVA